MLYCKFPLVSLDVLNFKADVKLLATIEADQEAPITLCESENERQKIEPVPIPLPRASRNCPDIKTRNNFFFHNWTSEIIPFIRFGMQMDRT